MNQQEPSDETLVSQIADGDKDAFAVLYDRYAGVIYTLATHTLGSSEAEEIVQDAFLRLWDKADQYDVSRGQFAAWFMTLVRNRVRDALRSYSRQARMITADEIDRLLVDTNFPGVEEIYARNDQHRRLVTALQELPEEQRRVVILAYFGDMSQSAMAEELNIPLGTVKKRIRLALQKLRRFFRYEEQVETES